MSDHSPEPWMPLSFCRIANAEGKSLAMTSGEGSSLPGPINTANAHRIVACVNAMAGIPNETLGAVKDLLDDLLPIPLSDDGRPWRFSTPVKIYLDHLELEEKEVMHDPLSLFGDPAKESTKAVEELVGTEPAEGERSRNQELRERLRQSEELTETAWGIIANAYGGDWDLASEASGWKAAAERWGKAYHKTLPYSSSRAETPVDGPARPRESRREEAASPIDEQQPTVRAAVKRLEGTADILESRISQLLDVFGDVLKPLPPEDPRAATRQEGCSLGEVLLQLHFKLEGVDGAIRRILDAADL